jgi:uncharacterized membrane protein
VISTFVVISLYNYEQHLCRKSYAAAISYEHFILVAPIFPRLQPTERHMPVYLVVHSEALSAIMIPIMMTELPSRPAPWIDRAVAWLFRHWLASLNLLVGIYAGLPWMSPWLKANGHPVAGEIIFRIYTPLCHQRPERSFCFCGYQVAFCHRCTAFYGGLFIVGILFSVVRRWIRPAPLTLGALLLVPMALDAGTHIINDLLSLGWRGGGDDIGSLNFWLRMITGALAALAVMLVVYPRLERELPAQVQGIGGVQ